MNLNWKLTISTMAFLVWAAGILNGCNKPSTVQPPSDDSYVVTQTHASDFINMNYIPATYEIKHGNVLAHTECMVLKRSGGGWDSCQSFPDPNVPVGVPLHMTRNGYNQLDWVPEKGGDGVTFRVLSEKVVKENGQ